MKTSSLFTICLLALGMHAHTQINQVPIISNLKGSFDQSGTGIFTYDVSDAENDPLEIIIEVSDDGGNTYRLITPAWQPTGDLGYPISQGTNKTITFPPTLAITQPASKLRVRLTALDKKLIDFASLVAQVDSNRLKTRLNNLQGIRHRSANAAKLAETQDSLQKHFESLSLGSNDQTFAFGAYTGRNIIGNLPGLSGSGQTVIVDAHYDTVSNSPGADDNGSGTVGMMEIARILAQYPSRKSLRFIGFDLEESGLVGSQRYVQALPATDTILGVFNFEMIGYYNDTVNSQQLPTGFNLVFPAAYQAVAQDSFRGNFITNVGNTASQDLINRFSLAASAWVPDLRVINVAAPGNGSQTPDLTRSDHAPFWQAGKKALMITDGANFRNECYHTPDDLIYKLNFKFMRQVSQATLAAVAELSETEHGSWSVITPDLTTSSEYAARVCKARAWRSEKTVHLHLDTCAEPNQNYSIQIFAMDGRDIHHEKLTMQPGTTTALPLQLSATSHYVVLLKNEIGQIIAYQKL